MLSHQPLVNKRILNVPPTPRASLTPLTSSGAITTLEQPCPAPLGRVGGNRQLRLYVINVTGRDVFRGPSTLTDSPAGVEWRGGAKERHPERGLLCPAPHRNEPQNVSGKGGELFWGSFTRRRGKTGWAVSPSAREVEGPGLGPASAAAAEARRVTSQQWGCRSCCCWRLGTCPGERSPGLPRAGGHSLLEDRERSGCRRCLTAGAFMRWPTEPGACLAGLGGGRVGFGLRWVGRVRGERMGEGVMCPARCLSSLGAPPHFPSSFHHPGDNGIRVCGGGSK